MQPSKAQRIMDSIGQQHPGTTVRVQEMTEKGNLYRHNGQTKIPRTDLPGTEVYVRTQAEGDFFERTDGKVTDPAAEMEKIIGTVASLGYLRGFESDGEPDPRAPQLEVATDDYGQIDGFSHMDLSQKVTMVTFIDHNPQR